MLAPATVLAQADTAASRARASRVGASIASAATERIAPDRIRVSITPKGAAAANLELFDAAGREVGATVTRDGAIQAVVDPRRWYVLAPAKTGRRALPKDGLEFPARYLSLAPDGTARLGGLFLRAARVPLTWHDDLRAYATDLLVGYEFVDGAERELRPPRVVTFFTEGANARIEAATVRVTRSGGAGFQRVTLTTTQHEGETLFTARAGPKDELESSVAVHREPGALKLSLPSTEIPAFGVGAATATVSLLARDGGLLAATSPLEVQLSSRRLRQPAVVVLPAGRSSVEVEVRSSGLGGDVLTARSGALEARQPLRLVFPMAGLVAALVGGATGGTARFVRNGRWRGLLLARRVAEGVVVGLILVGAAWAGLVVIDFSAGVLGTPFGAFVLAALGGYVGSVVLDRVAGKTFGPSKT